MYSVLYVDDEPELLELGQVFLQKYWNLTVTTVASPEEAFNFLKISTFDIIISDYQMPTMDGITFLKNLRKSQFFEPFILFTGKGREEVVIDAINNGADFYLQKGGPPKSQFTELFNMIQKAVGKRRAELELQRVSYQSKAIINHLPDPTFVINEKGIIIAWNKAMEFITWCNESDMIGKKLSECSQDIFGIPRLSLADYILSPEIPIQKWYFHVQFEGRTVMAETRMNLGKQKNRTIWLKASPLYDENDTIIGAIETLRDITHIRDNERDLIFKTHELQESKIKLQNIIDFIPDPTFAIDRDGKVIAWNRAIERMTKTDALSILGKGNHAYAIPFYNECRPTLIDLVLSDNPELSSLYDKISSIDDHLVAEVYNKTVYDGQGAYLWAIVAPLYDIQGNITGAIESIRDITSRKELELELKRKYEELGSTYEEIAAQNEEIRISFDELDQQKELLLKNERKFRGFIEHLPDGVIIHHNDTIQYVNPMASHILGYDNQEELIGIGSLEVVHPRCRDNITERISHSGTIENPFVKEFFLKKDGSDVPVEVAAISVPMEDSISVMTIFRDISNEYERKNALRQAQNKLKILSSITRHDIKNELLTIMIILDLVSESDIPESEAELLKRAFGPCEKILEQLQNTFEYQKIGILEPDWFNLRSLCYNAARHHRIEPSMYSFVGENVQIFADPLIEKVFENLIDNTIRHGKDVQSVRFRSERRNGDLYVLYEDDGGGVPDTEKHKIFEEGFGKNTGLGLFLIKEILAMTGISICECGEHGKGVRFEMYIPQGKWRI
ncbi:Sensor histidine kinase RcsC [anaerobic digester metagenome]